MKTLPCCQVRPSALKGWEQYSEPTALLFNPLLPPPAAGTVRVEMAFASASVALATGTSDKEGRAFGASIVTDVAVALQAAESR